MNKVYRMGSDVPLPPQELAKEANAICCRPVFAPEDFQGEKSRIAGNHCYCNGNGEFSLLPVNDPDVVAGCKRYMVCRKCGGYSHL